MSIRKILAFVLALLMITASTPAWGENSNADAYMEAIEMLQDNKYSEAAAAFAAIGNYDDATQLAMYCYAIAAGESGLYSAAVTNLNSLGAFRDSALLATYYAGRSYEDAQQYETAAELFAGLTFYRDVTARVSTYPEKINARDYAKAGLAEQNGQLETALNGFKALGYYSDSLERAAAVQEKINARDYANADLAEQNGQLETALNGFMALGSYSDSLERAAAVQDKINEQNAAAKEAARAEAYKAADMAEQDGDYAKAYSGFSALGDYLDSLERAAAVQDKGNYAQAMQYAYAGKFSQAYPIFASLAEKEYEDSAEKAYVLGVTTFASVKDKGNGIASFQFHDLWGIINVNTNTTVSPYWDSIGQFNSLGLAVVKKGDKYGYINSQGEIIVACEWNDVSEFTGNLCTVAQMSGNNYLFGLVDSTGAEVSGAQWRTLGNSANNNWNSKYNSPSTKMPAFSEGKIKVQNADGKWGFIDDTGSLVGEVIWDEIQNFSEGLAVATKDKKCGFINKDGQVVIMPQYAAASSFHEGLAAVKTGSTWQYIDQDNNVIIKSLYTMANDFSGGKADVFLPGTGWQIIDNTGSLLYFVNEQTLANYAAAVACLESGDYSEAYNILKSLAGYKDSAELMQKAYDGMLETATEGSKLPAEYVLANEKYENPMNAYLIFYDTVWECEYWGLDDPDSGIYGTTATVAAPGMYSVSCRFDVPVKADEIGALVVELDNTNACEDACVYVSDVRFDGVSAAVQKGNTFISNLSNNNVITCYPIVDIWGIFGSEHLLSWDGEVAESNSNLLDMTYMPEEFSTIEIDFIFGTFVKK